jgi:iron complex transport system substrate-binding protein
VALAASLLAACSTGSTADVGDSASDPSAQSSVDADAFPVTIKHALGETTIEKEPSRVATLGWSDQDYVLALGVVPVGATKLTWGGNAAGSSDWYDAKLDELGGTQATRYDDADGAPVEEIAALAPDLIIATNSGITKAEYDKLSKIAPVVPYPGKPYLTPWQDSMKLVATALGRSTLGKQVIADTEKAIGDAQTTYPQLDGATMVFADLNPADLSQVGIYYPTDPRVSFLLDLGLVQAPSIADLSTPGDFEGTVSAERARDLDSDVLVSWAENSSDVKTILNHDLVGQIPALASGHYVIETDKGIALAITNPTPLSIPYLIKHFVPDVASAIDGS